MASHLRLKLLVASLGIVATSMASAATEKALHAQSLDAVPASQLSVKLGLSADNAFVAKNALPTVKGTQTVRMQQTFKGVPVYGRSIAVEQDAQGNALVANGIVESGLQVELASVTPKIDQTRALAALQRSARTLATAAPIENAKADLYVYPQEGAPARLVYLTSYFSGGDHPTRPTAIIDANTGEIIEQWEGLTNAEVDATGPGGNQKVGQYTWGANGLPALRVTQSGSNCTAKNAYVETYNLNHATSGTGTLWSFTCFNSNGSPINGGYGPMNDAHHYGGVVHDMYVAYTGGAPLNQVLKMQVHYGNSVENAYWNGTYMQFGDGASTFYPLVALDVTSHEISHGYTEQHSNLAYTGQSGGMNEAYSDIAGEAAEYFDRGTNDFLVGSDIVKNSAGIGGALRFMCNPTQDGASIDNASDYYSGLDVHYSSGVYNKAFCLLAKDQRLGHREGVQGLRSRRRPVLDGQLHVQQWRMRRRERGHRPGVCRGSGDGRVQWRGRRLLHGRRWWRCAAERRGEDRPCGKLGYGTELHRGNRGRCVEPQDRHQRRLGRCGSLRPFRLRADDVDV